MLAPLSLSRKKNICYKMNTFNIRKLLKVCWSLKLQTAAFILLTLTDCPLYCRPFRNCGNVFCASCCDHKATNQQLYEPNRVCQACYGHLRPSAVPPVLPPADLELEKPITASSNWTEPADQRLYRPLGILTKSAEKIRLDLVELPTPKNWRFKSQKLRHHIINIIYY